MRVIYEGDMVAASGYSRAARMHGRALLEAGVDVRFRNRRKDRHQLPLDPYWRDMLSERLVDPGEEGDLTIWHETPEFYEPKPGTKNVALLAWETDRLPSIDLDGDPRKNWVRQLNLMDEVWVPCHHNQDVFKRSGVISPVHVVPHPIRLEDYPLDAPPMVPRDPNRLNLLSVFQWQPRKDPLRLLLGFYGTKATARLLLKTYAYDFSSGQGEIVRNIQGVKRSFHQTPANVVTPIFEPLADHELPGLYSSCDAYVTTTHGEGFCLPAVEAMAMEKPVIGPRWSAFEDFLFEHEPGRLIPSDASTGYEVAFRLEPVYGMGQVPWYSADQRWAAVDVDSLIQKIEEAAEGKRDGTLERRGRKARELVGRLFDPVKIGNQMKMRLEEICKT